MNGVDVVIRDYEGEVLGAYASKKTGFVDSFMVEAKADVCALEFAYEMGMRNIILEGEKKLQIRKSNLSPIETFISET